MAAIFYTMHERARGVSGHTVGVLYSFDVALQAYNNSTSMKKAQHVALNGATETVLRGVYETISITIGPYPDSLHDDVIEFIDSVAGGEAFTLDAFGSVSVSDNPISVVLTNQSIRHTRIQHGTTPHRTAQLNVRVQ